MWRSDSSIVAPLGQRLLRATTIFPSHMPHRRLSATQAAQIGVYTARFAVIGDGNRHRQLTLVYQAPGALTRYKKDLSCVVSALVIDAGAGIGDDEAEPVGAAIEDTIYGGNHDLSIIPLRDLVALFIELRRESACHLACNGKGA